MINLVWLKTFCTLADVGHFTRTADLLYMTQSGVSQHIQKLELHLGTSLLIREGKSFSLTDAGITLYQQGQNLLKNADEIEDSIKQDETFIGKVRLATPGSVGLKLYPHLLAIQQQHPTLIIDYSFAPNRSIEKELVERKIDIGIVTELSRDVNLISEEIAQEPLVLVTSINVDSINWQTLKNMGFIKHPDADHHAHQLLSKNFSDFEHTNQFEHKGFSNQISLILEPVSYGLGFTVLPLHAVKGFHKQNSIKIHTLKHRVSETLYLCQHRHSFESKRIKYIKAEIKNFIV